MDSQVEAKMIARCRRGEADAWNELFDLHYAPTGRFVFQLGSDFAHEDVEEICQETFLTVIKNLRTFNGRSQLQTWIFRIAANKAHDYREKLRAAKRGGGKTTVSLQQEDSETGLTIDPPSLLPGPDANLLQAEQMASLDRALQELDPPCREMIEMKYFGDLSYEEIGQALQINTKTVSSRLSRCLDRLEDIARRLFSTEIRRKLSV